MKTFATFFVITLIFLTTPVFALQSTSPASCTGHWDGEWFWQKSDSTITEYWEWKALDTMAPYIGASERKDPASIFGRVTTSQSTRGFGTVGVTAKGDVSGPGNFALEVGFQWSGGGVGWNPLGETTSISATASESTTTEGSYTLSGTGEAMGVVGGGSVGLLGFTLKGEGEVRFNSSPTFSAPSALSVTTEQDRPKAYECAHVNCEVALPNKHHHRVTCKEKVYFALGSVVKVDCNHKYYKCQTSTCENDGKHIIPHACGHEDEKEDAWKHEMQTSCSSSTTQNGSTVYCQSSNFYLCQHENHEWPAVNNPPPSGGGSNPPGGSGSDPPINTPPSTPVLCANTWTGSSACTYGRVVSGSDAYEHQATCPTHGKYWSCNPSAVAEHAPSRACRRSGCDNTWARCQKAPMCDVWSGNKCWAL